VVLRRTLQVSLDYKRGLGVYGLEPDAAPDRGHHRSSQCRSEGQPGGGGSTELDRVALIGVTAFWLDLVEDSQEGAVAGADAAISLSTALGVKAHEISDVGEGGSRGEAEASVGWAGLLSRVQTNPQKTHIALVTDEGVRQHEGCNHCKDPHYSPAHFGEGCLVAFWVQRKYVSKMSLSRSTAPSVVMWMDV